MTQIFEEFVDEFFKKLFSPGFLFLILLVATVGWVMEELPDKVWGKLRKWGVV
ncbi:MAG: hypothetical protein HY006_03735 [Candidatus Sungbacteria bacterium]|nr:hypothetical protein [Candidatus Sungbacteria bacterium]